MAQRSAATSGFDSQAGPPLHLFGLSLQQHENTSSGLDAAASNDSGTPVRWLLPSAALAINR